MGRLNALAFLTAAQEGKVILTSSAKANANSQKLEAAAALLADDLRAASQDFEVALQTHDWRRDDLEDYEVVSPDSKSEGDVRPVILTGGFAGIRDRQFFEEQQAQFLIRARGTIGEFFPKLVSIASQESDIALAVEAAKAVATSVVREHGNPESILLRAFPALADEGIDLPLTLTPPGESDPVEAICSRIKTALDDNIARNAKLTLIHLFSHASLSTNVARLRTKAKRRKRRTKCMSSDEARRRCKTIQELCALKCKGGKYCVGMDQREIPIPTLWREDGCPSKYADAYKKDEKWRARIQQEKYRHSKHAPIRDGE